MNYKTGFCQCYLVIKLARMVPGTVLRLPAEDGRENDVGIVFEKMQNSMLICIFLIVLFKLFWYNEVIAEITT